jgi:predicted nucleotide-binding protein
VSIPHPLPRLLEAVKEAYECIEVRTIAANIGGTIYNVVTLIQFSTSSPDECKGNLLSRLAAHDPLADGPLKFDWEFLPATKWSELVTRLKAKSGELCVGRLTASLEAPVDLNNFKSTISDNGYIKNPTPYPMFQDRVSTFPEGMSTELGRQLVGVVHSDAVRLQLNHSGFDWFIELASVYLGAYNVDPGEPSLVVIVAPVPAMIGNVKVIAEDHRIRAHVLSHPKLKDSLSLKGYTGNGSKKAPRFGELVPCDENQAFAEADFEPLLTGDVEVRLVHNILGIIHSRPVCLAPNVQGPATRPEREETKPMIQSREIFVVHGHDEAMKQSVARVLEKLVLKPIILDERPNNGRTIIEKFEAHSSNVGFAIVLLTADDVGGADKDALEPRARENVIFELGYFMGKLGRKRVCVLQKPDVKFPSDIHGLLWIGFDDASGWKLKLASEIKASGIEIDLNKL